MAAAAAAAVVAADAEFERNPGRPGELVVAILILGTFLILASAALRCCIKGVSKGGWNRCDGCDDGVD